MEMELCTCLRAIGTATVAGVAGSETETRDGMTEELCQWLTSER